MEHEWLEHNVDISIIKQHIQVVLLFQNVMNRVKRVASHLHLWRLTQHREKRQTAPTWEQTEVKLLENSCSIRFIKSVSKNVILSFVFS